MYVHLGLRHDRLLRKQAAEMFEKGLGYDLTAKRLGMSAATVREWQKMYRVIGKGGLLTMGVKHTKYDYETKVAAAKAVVDGGMSKPEAMVRFGIASTTPLKQWCRLYREGGAQALKPKPKGRPKGSVRAVPPTREEELEERVRKLEAQVAYLKKSIARPCQVELLLRVGSSPAANQSAATSQGRPDLFTYPQRVRSQAGSYVSAC